MDHCEQRVVDIYYADYNLYNDAVNFIVLKHNYVTSKIRISMQKQMVNDPNLFFNLDFNCIIRFLVFTFFFFVRIHLVKAYLLCGLKVRAFPLD